MKKYFCNYEQSLALKELGFDEPCLAWYNWTGKELIFTNNQHVDIDPTNAPLKSQVFDWFRKKYRLSVLINDCLDDYIGEIIRWTLTDDKIIIEVPNRIKTYEEAESACIDKLIEIVKKEKT